MIIGRLRQRCICSFSSILFNKDGMQENIVKVLSCSQIRAKIMCRTARIHEVCGTIRGAIRTDSSRRMSKLR